MGRLPSWLVWFTWGAILTSALASCAPWNPNNFPRDPACPDLPICRDRDFRVRR